jgi:prepilin-type N-terminal cleavage/methylation domain-containing protein
MMKARYHKEDGFTLLEVMTSMFIMGFALLLLLHLAMIALDGNKWAAATTSSTQLMQAKLEELRSSPTPTVGVDTVGEVVRSWRVTHAASYLAQIDITASWLTMDSISQSYSISTLVKTDTP